MNRQARRARTKQRQRQRTQPPPPPRPETPEWFYRYERFGPPEIGHALKTLGLHEEALYYHLGRYRGPA